MYFPLADFLPDIERVHEIIPKSGYMTKEEILSLTPEDIHSLQVYSFYLLPRSFSEERSLDFVLNICQNTYEKIPKNCVVIAPGDSPSKIMQLIRLIYGDERMNLVTFPISGLGESITDFGRELLDSYITEIVEKNNIRPTDELCYVDYISGGSTYRELLGSLRRVFQNNGLTMKKINLGGRYREEDQIFHLVVSGAESYGARCVPSYYLDLPIPHQPHSSLICNVIITLVYLFYLERLEMLNLPSPNADSLRNAERGTILLTKFYDVHTITVREEKILFSGNYGIYRSLIGVTIPETGYDFENVSIKPSALIDVRITDRVNNLYKTSDLRGIQGNYLEIDLINGETITGWFDKEKIEYGINKSLYIQARMVLGIRIVNIETRIVKEDLTDRLRSLSTITYLDNGIIKDVGIYLVKVWERYGMVEGIVNGVYSEISTRLILDIKN